MEKFYSLRDQNATKASCSQVSSDELPSKAADRVFWRREVFLAESSVCVHFIRILTAYIMRICLFCRQRANSEEHPIALWLIERMEAESQPIRVGKRSDSNIDARQQHLLKSLTVRRVCKECNEGWMNDLETWFREKGGLLVEPTWPCLADTIVSELQRDQHARFARWAIKTAIMLDQSGMLKPPVISESFAQDLFNKTITSGITVELAFLESAEVAVIFSAGYWAYNGPGPATWQKHSGGLGFNAWPRPPSAWRQTARCNPRAGHTRPRLNRSRSGGPGR